MTSKHLLIYILLLWAIPTIAQQPQFFEQYTTFNTGNNGLIDNHVYASCVSREGNLWFGTSSGISFYDGEQWLSYHQFNSGLQADTVFALADDGNLIWAGTNNGTWVFDGQNWTSFPENHLLGKVRVLDILVDTRNRIWFGLTGLTAVTNDHTGQNASPSLVLMKDGNRWTSFSKADGITGQVIHSVYEDQYNNIWLATDGGACKYNGQMWIPYTTDNGLPCDHIVDVLQDSTKKMWFATCASGVVSYDWVNWQQMPLDEPENDSIMTLFLDKKQQVWAGTRSGYARLQGGQWQKLEAARDFRVESHSGTMLEDQAGDMWFSSGSGLMTVSESGERYFNTFDGLASNNIKDAFVDKAGGNWFITTEQTVGHEQDGVWKNFNVEAGEADQLDAIFITENQGIWATGSKVWKLEGQTFIEADLPEILPIQGEVNYIWENDKQQLCAAIQNGQGTIFKSFVRKEGAWEIMSALEGHRIYEVVQNNDSGSAGEPDNVLSTDAEPVSHQYFLTRVDQTWNLLQSTKEGFHEISLPSFAGNANIHAVTETATGIILLATDRGIMVYEKNAWSLINTSDGLANVSVSDIALDKAGNIWAVYGHFLPGTASMFDGKEWLHFNEENGLPQAPLTKILSFNGEDQTVQPFLTFVSSGAGFGKLPQPDLQVELETIELDKQQQTITIPIESNVGWQVSPTVSWLSPRIIQGEGSLEITVDVQTNNSTVVRQGVVNISTGILKSSIEVRQRGQEGILLLEDNELSFEKTGEVKSTSVFTNTNITFTVSDEDWMTVTLEPQKSKTIVHVRVEACNACSREGKITFKGGGLEQTLKVFQGHLITALPRDASIEMEVYPNPTSGVLHLSGQIDTYQVFDMLGNIVSMGNSSRSERPISIDMSNVPKGLYLVNAVKDKGQKTVKILVE